MGFNFCKLAHAGAGGGQVMLVHLGKKSKVAVFRWPRFHGA